MCCFEFLNLLCCFLHPADEDERNDLLKIGLIYGGGTVLSDFFFKAVDRRIERTLIRTLSYPYYIELTYAFSSCYVNLPFTLIFLFSSVTRSKLRFTFEILLVDELFI